ncbi:MAG: (2Fe-2S)-binding protein [Gemmatimonadota bacterium]|jgi:aerobic-type carbon monoxide dehydrogenase small subunit (CoxS/CutS family)
MKETIRFTLNGKPVTVDTDGSRKLLWVLRTDLELTGTKYGCGEGICGACAVMVNGRVVRSCRESLSSVRNREVLTIEGLAANGSLHPLQQAFHEHGGFQCGYCTPGMIMTAYGLLQDVARPSREQILEEMQYNLCRCGAHQRIVEAISAASGQTGGDHD